MNDNNKARLIKARLIKASTEKKLFGLSQNQCYAPNCQNKLITHDKKDVLAKIAHIEAASKNGPRFNSNMTDDERRDFDNLILLCDEHHIAIDNNPKEYPTALLKEWKLLHEGTNSDFLFQKHLKSTYQNKFKTISLLINDKQKPIEDIYVNLAIIKDKKEEKENKKLISREAFLSSYEEIHKPKEPIEIKDLIHTSKKSLIYGKAGIGKTTLCKYISYMWAKGELYQEFNYIIYISLRGWKNKGLKGAIKDNYYSQDDEDISLNIKENSQNILFLFDGYDELIEEKKKDLKKEIDTYALTHYIITSRPYGYQRNDFSVDEHFETIGFTDENVDSYIDNFFEDKEGQKSLKTFVQSNISIKHIAYIPLMLEMICSLWKQGELGSNMTMTELYSQVVEDMLKKHSAIKNDERVYKRQNRKKIKEQLGKIAFEGLTKQTILFNGDLIEGSIDDVEFFEQNLIYSGFLKSDIKEKDLLDNNFEFPHLTFQEYFSAYYVSNLPKKKQKKIIKEYKFYPHMQMFFAFLGGLIKKKDKEFLLSTIEDEPRDLIGVYEFNLIVICVKEIKHEELQDKRRKKIFKQVFNELTSLPKYYLDEKPSNLLFISHIIDNDFMNIFIEKSVHKEIQVDVIAKELISHNKLKFVNFFMEYIANKQINERFREGLFFALKMSHQIIDVFNQKDIISIFLNEDDNSKVQENLVSLLIKIAQENNKKLKDNDANNAIVNSFIEKFEIIKKINYCRNNPISFLAVNSQKNKKVNAIFLLTIEKDIDNKQLIKNIANAFTIMKCNDNSNIIKALITIVNNSKDESHFRANIAISLLKLEDDVSEFFESLIELINHEDIPVYTRVKIASSLMFKGLNEDRFKKLFLELINHEEVKTEFNHIPWDALIVHKPNINGFIVDLQDLVYRDKKEIINMYIYFLNHLYIKKSVKRNILEFLFNYPYKIDENLIDTFFKIIENENIHAIQKSYITQLLVSLATYEPLILDTFDKLIMSNSKVNIYIAQYLPRCENRCIKCIEILVTLLKDNTLEEHYREKVFKALITFSKAQDNRKHVKKALSSLEKIDDEFINKLFEIEHEKIIAEKKNSDLFQIKDNTLKASVYSGGKPIYAPKFNENEIVTKETILVKIKESKKHSFAGNILTLKFLNCIEEKYINFLMEIIHDESVEFDKRDILIVLSKFLDKNEGLKKEFKKIYISDKPIYMRDIIIDKFMAIHEIDFFLDILNKHEYTMSNISTIIHYLISLKQEEIENKLIEIAQTNTNFNIDFQPYMNISLLFKAYDKQLDTLDQIKKKFIQKEIPLYLSKDKNLCTIIDGSLISTDRKIDNNILKYFPRIKQRYIENKNQVTPKNNRPLIITEGKTDWKHLKKALDRFQSDEFNLYENLEIEFKSFENISMSDSELDAYAQSHAKKINSRRIICIFDRDLPKRVDEYGQSDFVHVTNKQLMNTIKNKCKKEYGETSKAYRELEMKLDLFKYKEVDTEIQNILKGKEYKEWETQLNNNVYAFCIPKLNDELDEICIEFYYKEKDLKKENSEGKRLFTADEFEFKDKVNNWNRFISKCGKFKTDTQSGNNQNRQVTLQYPNKNNRGYVYKIEEEECIKANNMNLSKNDFIKNIENEVEGFDDFDIENFKLIFDVIQKIIRD